MSLERSIEISKAPEQHSMTLFDEVFSQMQSSVAVKTKQAQSDNGKVARTADGRQITIDSDGSILVGQPSAIAN
ncbi:MAG: hypothetical protein WC028_32185 [Candidatus Obscuribacterales bacterium]|jgi:hypothetical protein